MAWAEIDKEEGRMITLYIPNISYSQLIIVKEVLVGRIPGVDRCVQRSYTAGIGEIVKPEERVAEEKITEEVPSGTREIPPANAFVIEGAWTVTVDSYEFLEEKKI